MLKSQLQQIKTAIQKREYENIKALTTDIDIGILTYSLDANCINQMGGHETLLHCAARYGCVSIISVLAHIQPEKFLLKDFNEESVLKLIAVRHYVFDCQLMPYVITDDLLLSASCYKSAYDGTINKRTVLFQAGSEGWFHDLIALKPVGIDFSSLIMRANTMEPFLITAVREGWIQDITSQVKLFPEMLIMNDSQNQKFLQMAVVDKDMLDKAGDELLGKTNLEMMIAPIQGNYPLFNQALEKGNIQYFAHLLNFNNLLQVFHRVCLFDNELNTILKACKISEIQKIAVHPFVFTFSRKNNLNDNIGYLLKEKFSLWEKILPVGSANDIIKAELALDPISGDTVFDDWVPVSGELAL